MLQRLKLCVTTRVKKMQEALVGVVARDIVADHAHVRFVQAENGIAICTLLFVIANTKEHGCHSTTLRLLVVVLHVNVCPLAQNGVVQHNNRVVHHQVNQAYAHTPLLQPHPFPLTPLPSVSSASTANPAFRTPNCTGTPPSCYTPQRTPTSDSIIGLQTWIISAASAKFKLDLPPSNEIITDSKSSKYSSSSAATSMFQLSARSLKGTPRPNDKPNGLQEH